MFLFLWLYPRAPLFDDAKSPDERKVCTAKAQPILTAEDMDFRRWATIWFSIMRSFFFATQAKGRCNSRNYDEPNRIEENRFGAKVLHVYRESCRMQHVCVCVCVYVEVEITMERTEKGLRDGIESVQHECKTTNWK